MGNTTYDVRHTTRASAAPSRAYAWYALFLLSFINLLNYLDRNVIFALFEPIKGALNISDAQLGWLGSAYVLVFSVAAFVWFSFGACPSMGVVVTSPSRAAISMSTSFPSASSRTM